MQYSSLVSRFASYNEMNALYSTYSDLLNDIMSKATFGEYELQVFKYQPLAYWYVVTEDSAAIEPSIYASDAELEKISAADGYKPLIYSSDPGTNILFSEDYLFVDKVEFDKIKIARYLYKTQPFTINFWYHNVNNVISPDEPIFRIGDYGDYRIDLYTKDGRFLLDFLGQKTYIEVDDYRQIFNISIVFDGENSKLIVNGSYGTRISNKDKEFDMGSVFAFFQSGSGCTSKFAHITMYGYELSQAQAQKLYSIGTKTTNYLDYLYNLIDGVTFNNTISDFHKTIDYKISSSDIITRNCYLLNDVLFLKSKNMATINGATFSTNKYLFSGSQNINFQIIEGDVDRNNASFKVTSSNLSSSSGTALYIECSQPIHVKLSSGNISVYSTSSETAIFSGALSSETYFAVELIDAQIWVNVGGVKTNTNIAAPLSFKSVTIGNNGESTDAYSGGISNFSLNYANQPLQVGIYTLDLSTSYTNYVKPKQDGVALFDFVATSNTTVNYATFNSSGGVEVQFFDSSNTLDQYYSCSGGTEIKDGGSVFSTPLSSDEAIIMAARLYDTYTGSSYSDINFPKISGFRYLGYSSNEILSDNSSVTISSAVDLPYIPSRIYNEGLLIKTNSQIDINGSGTSVKSVFFYMKAEEIVSTNTIFEFAGTTLTLTKINSTTYKLSVDNGATLYVNGTSFAAGVQSGTLYINEHVYVGISMTTSQDLTPYFINCANISISELCFSNDSSTDFDYAITRMHKAVFSTNAEAITDSDTISLTDSIIGKAFTSNIVFSG